MRQKLPQAGHHGRFGQESTTHLAMGRALKTQAIHKATSRLEVERPTCSAKASMWGQFCVPTAPTKVSCQRFLGPLQAFFSEIPPNS